MRLTSLTRLCSVHVYLQCVHKAWLSPGVSCVVWDQWWTYDGISGTSYWGVFNPDWGTCHKGRRQSPINVEPDSLLFDPQLGYLHVDNAAVSGCLRNSGHGLVFSVLDSHRGQVNITGASLSYGYQFQEVHIHFGMKNARGSEHQISGKPFPAEVQLLGYNANLYPNLTAAASGNSGIVIVAVLVQQGSATSHQLARLADASVATPYRDDAICLANVSVSELLPSTEFYLTYEGSLTWPGCDESVTWVLMNKPIYITTRQLEQLRRLSQSLQTDDTRSPLGDNFRTPQPLHRRPVRTNIDFTGVQGSSASCPKTQAGKRYEVGGWLKSYLRND
ncbi:carbonic anhydrase-related protein 10-like [Pollicipes pollicipes]|uniref:carbonic anhydrase-related protein 10-like n=1 Tax=Pollicipes pollicipes TaxID=41117 RepID=UPI001884C2DF|nr:carbonic anhydrase-related protein 10-like [Pollicipes pollicipes]